MQRGSIVGHLPAGFADYIYSLFVDLKENFTTLWYVYNTTVLFKVFLFTLHVEVIPLHAYLKPIERHKICKLVAVTSIEFIVELSQLIHL